LRKSDGSRCWTGRKNYLLAKHWREDGDRDAAHQLVTFEGRRLAEDAITLAQLADEFGVSRERVRQIEPRAFEKVQKAVKNRVAGIEMPADVLD
jgi:hypothetical protein